MEHAREIERAFTTQADAFEDAAHNRVFTADARWAVDALPLSRDDLVVDVAAGTGHAARQLAPSVRAVVAVDATAAMLARGRRAALDDGLANVVFMRGDASALPFLDGSFDVATCRFAVHHFERPADVVSELARVVGPGGHVAVVDLIADDDPGVAAAQNRLERLRDPSHTRMLARDELVALLADAGLSEVNTTTRVLERPLAPWLEQSRPEGTAADEIRSALRADLAGGPATGFRPRAAETGELSFTQTFAACIACTGG